MSTGTRDAVRTRASIVGVARRHFAVYGYDRTTVRAIAGETGVSANLITRYFGGKQGLFTAATEIDLQVERLLVGSPDDLGRRIAERVVARWESAPGDDPMVTMLRAAMSDPQVAARTAAMFHDQAVAPLAAFLGGPQAWERAASVGSFIKGTLVDRYVLGAPVLAGASPEQVVEYLGGVLQLLLTGPSPACLR